MAPRVTLYTRQGCCLCDTAKQELQKARRHAAFELEEIDIDQDPQLRVLYNDEVPVVTIDGKKAFKYHIEEQAFLKRLRDRT